MIIFVEYSGLWAKNIITTKLKIIYHIEKGKEKGEKNDYFMERREMEYCSLDIRISFESRMTDKI